MKTTELDRAAETWSVGAMEELSDLRRSAETLEWLQSRGLCWRGAEAVFPGWRIGDETEWHYRNAGDVRELVDKHKDILKAVSNNVYTHKTTK